MIRLYFFFFFFSSRRRHTRSLRDWSSDVCSSDLHDRRRLRHLGAKALDRLVERQDLLAVGNLGQVEHVHGNAFGAPAALGGATLARVLDEDVPHGFGGGMEEMGAVCESRIAPAAGQSQ